MKRVPPGLMLAFALAAAVHTQAADSTAEIAAVVRSFDAPAPGASVAVVQHGQLVFAGGFGRADLARDTPITADTVFNAGSIGKQVTAFAILLLERDGKLKLGDDVRTHLPELPDYGKPITLRQLLRHQSGIRDVFYLLGLGGKKLDGTCSGDRLGQEEALRIIVRQKALNFPPGEGMLYSNSGYVLLAEIVTRLSGRPFDAFCAERIFGPLKMTRTRFVGDEKDLPAGCAESYLPEAGTFSRAALQSMIFGVGNLYTTAPDLARWLDNFRTGEVGGAALVARLFRVTPEKWADDYQLGVMTGSWRGQRIVFHDGFIGGFQGLVTWFPEHELGIVVLGNRADFNSHPITDRVAETVLQGKLPPAAPTPPPPKERTFVAVAPEVLARYAGVYTLVGEAVEFQIVHGQLVWGGLPGLPLEMKPLSENRFWVEPIAAELEFTPTADGGMHLHITQPGGTTDSHRLGPVTAAEMADYLGTFSNTEIDTAYTFAVRNGRLCAVHPQHGEIPLMPVDTDRFQAARFFLRQIDFVRDGDRRVVAVKLGGPRTGDIPFTRVTATARD